MRNVRFSCYVLLVLILGSANWLLAQETTAGLQGIVRDPTGAVVPGATVELTSPALIGSKKTETDAGGNYRLVALAPGSYTVTVAAKGFRTYKLLDLDLAVGRLPNLDIKLEVGAVAETIEVTGTQVLVDTTQSKVAVAVGKDVFDWVPKGRSFETLIPFAPGARNEPLSSGYQVDGASDAENVFMVDGINTTQIRNGGSGKNFQMDFVQEFQVKSSSFEAEFGGALGGVINVVPKRGSNAWHGSIVYYLRTNGLNANNGDRGLRTNPTLPSLSSANRLDAVPEYYMARKDQSTTSEPGYEVGGPLKSNRLWLFSSYIPEISVTRRTTTFTGNNPGARTLTQSSTQHNMYNRLDYGVTDSLRLFGAWNYAYTRTTGTLGAQDSEIGQRNTGASTDPNTLRADAGSVRPLATYTFGGDWTPNSRTVVSARYGYFFQNAPDRGRPVGTRYVYSSTVNAASRDLADQPFPSSSFNTSGYFNIPSNLAYAYDADKRKSFNADASYLVRGLGSHVFKGGVFWQSQANEVLRTFNGGAVNLYWGQSYSPVTSTTACDAIIASNRTAYGKSLCQGRFGYFIVGTSVVNTGGARQTAKALYFQDSWQTGKGLTLNLGIRFDQETQPPYDPKRFPTVQFGWGDKIAPRLGGAYDVFRNGKLKVYASYGKFFDIMKMGLARGSFGSDYWHNCYYAMDDADFTKITPTYPIGGGCPATGPAPGVNVGRFIENVDFRATKADPRDPAISPSMKPMEQHEFVTGVDWALSNDWSLETRYSRKRLDRTIEDMAITDNLGFYVGNPGSTFADVLHRPVVIDGGKGDYLTTVPFCAECPPTIGAIRRYDGLEFRLTRRATGRWFGTVSYTYSKLRGNYAGLSNTDPTDGGGGRHSPNNHRAFDIPTMTYLPNGQIDDGPLSTDRPHTAKIFGFYRQKWLGMESLIGLTQLAFQGTSLSSCLPVVGTSSACQWAEGRGNWVNLSRAANGDIVKGDVVKDARSDNFFQTDLSFNHQIRTGEGKRLEFEAVASNLFNQRAGTIYYEFMIPTNLVNPSRPSRFPGDPQIDWAKVMKGYNYIDAMNGTGAFGGGVQPKLTLAGRYGMPSGFQTARNIRLAVRFTF